MTVRNVETIRIARIGSVAQCDMPGSPAWQVVDPSGTPLLHVEAWFLDLLASDYSDRTLRAYAYDLLNWHRFLWAVDVSWNRATRIEVRDWVRWHQTHANPQRTRSADSLRPLPSSINTRTGKSYLSNGYAPATINRMLACVKSFYDYAVSLENGPLSNPVPKQRAELERSLGSRSYTDRPFGENNGRRAAYRQKKQKLAPRAVPDDLFNELFQSLGHNRDRAIVSIAVSSGARASEMLSIRRSWLHAENMSIDVIPKGGRSPVAVKASPDAFMWSALYLAERNTTDLNEAFLMTLRGAPRPMTYWALRQVLERANNRLGSNITFHDLRHTYGYRLAQDPEMLITDVQELMRHQSVTTTQTYIRSRMDDVVDRLMRHYSRPPAPATRTAEGYQSNDMQTLFPGSFE